MIICQTLWTNKKDLTKNSFGWRSPQHHLMGWALSCLKLKKHYKAVNLYTDKEGERVLINELALPYTTFFTDYNELNCNPDLWAFPKLLTYAKQTQPFLHVDGDVLIWKPLSESLLSSELIAQNMEKGTEYYEGNFQPFLSQINYLPRLLKVNLTRPNIYAYNAGIIGGTNIDFFKDFVSLAKGIIKKNDIPDLTIDFNIIFEQILFFSLSRKRKKNVSCLKDEIIDDNGYSKKKFADFVNAENLGYLHLIGPFKRDKETCDWLARCLLQENEEVFLRITDLFKSQHFFYNKPTETNFFVYPRSRELIKSLYEESITISNSELAECIRGSENVLLKELYKYESAIRRILLKYSKIGQGCLKSLEYKSMRSIGRLKNLKKDKSDILLYRNSYIDVLHTAFDWTTMTFFEMNNIGIRCSSKKDIVIGITPELFFNGYRETVLDKICVNIIILTEKSIKYNTLLEKLRVFFPPIKNKKEQKDFLELVFIKIQFLVKNKIIFIND